MIIVRIIVFGLIFVLLSCKSTTVIQESYSSKETIHFEDYILKSTLSKWGHKTVYKTDEDSIINNFKDYLSSLGLSTRFESTHENRITEEVINSEYPTKEKIMELAIENISTEDTLLRIVPYIESYNRIGSNEGGDYFYSILRIQVYILKGKELIYNSGGVKINQIDLPSRKYIEKEEYRKETVHSYKNWKMVVERAMEDYIRRLD